MHTPILRSRVISEFEAKLVYQVKSKTVRATQKNTVLKTMTKQQTNIKNKLKIKCKIAKYGKAYYSQKLERPAKES